MHLVNAETGELFAELEKEGASGPFLLTLSLSPDEKRLISSSHDGSVHLLDTTPAYLLKE